MRYQNIQKSESYKLFLKVADSLETTHKIMALCCRMYYAEKVIAEKKQSSYSSDG